MSAEVDGDVVAAAGCYARCPVPVAPLALPRCLLVLLGHYVGFTLRSPLLSRQCLPGDLLRNVALLGTLTHLRRGREDGCQLGLCTRRRLRSAGRGVELIRIHSCAALPFSCDERARADCTHPTHAPTGLYLTKRGCEPSERRQRIEKGFPWVFGGYAARAGANLAALALEATHALLLPLSAEHTHDVRARQPLKGSQPKPGGGGWKRGGATATRSERVGRGRGW